MKPGAVVPASAAPPSADAERLRARALEGYARCQQRQRSGQLLDVVEEAPRALLALAGAGLEEEHRELLYVLALSACEAGRFDVSLEATHALSDAIGPQAAPAALLKAAYALGACLERMGDSWQAERVMSEALAAAGDAASAHERMVILNGLTAITIGVFHRLRDVEDAAEGQAVLERARSHATRARALMAQVGDMSYQVAIGGNLGEVLTHLGELEPAWALLAEARASAQANGMRAHVWRIECSIGEWLLASGRADEARGAMNALLIEMDETAPPQTRIRAFQAAYRACRVLARFEEALSNLEQAERLERRRVTSQLRAQSQLFVTRSEAEHARRDAQHHRRRANEFAEHAERDMLTGLGNRRLLQRRCAELVPVAERDGRPLALAVLDVDHFKDINDRFGHAAGDAVLVGLAQLLRENTRAGDVLVRHGGEEFVVVLPGMAMARAVEVCERLREHIAAHDWARVVEAGLAVTVSIGLAVSPPYDAQDLLSRADSALYRAKNGGRNRVCQA